ncbi:MAG: hypothetical protein LC785_16135 [Acidobacteria bacterium]|nr:hypothetical protein [Acidobacteriota bacterium]MCA1643433.1 hypothetical protein [Acidobacteriota bacterium]
MTAITNSCGGGRAGRYAMVITSVLFIVLACGAGVSAQEPSTDRDAPTAFASNEVKGAGTDEKTEYFYSFKAGPGEVTLTFDVKADKGANLHGFDYEVFDAKSRRLAGGFLDPVRGESKRRVETVKLKGTLPQELVLKLVVTEYVDTYRIRLGGAVVIAPAETAPPQATEVLPPAQGGETPTAAETPATATEPATPTGETAPAAAASGDPASGEKTKEASLKEKAKQKAKDAAKKKVSQLLDKIPPF